MQPSPDRRQAGQPRAEPKNSGERRGPGKTKPSPPPSAFARSSTLRAPEEGTPCSRPDLVRSSGIVQIASSRSNSGHLARHAGFPPFDAVSPLFQCGGIRYGPAARTADRAVPVELRRFLAVNHIIFFAPDKHERIGIGPRRLGDQDPPPRSRPRRHVIRAIDRRSRALGSEQVLRLDDPP